MEIHQFLSTQIHDKKIKHEKRLAKMSMEKNLPGEYWQITVCTSAFNSEIIIEKTVPRITVWHQEACRVMTNDDRQGQIFLSHPHMNNGLFFLLNTKYLIIYWKNMKKISRKSWIRWEETWWCNFNITMTSWIDVRPAYGCSFFYLSHGLVRVFEIWLVKKRKSWSGVRESVLNKELVCSSIFYICDKSEGYLSFNQPLLRC